MTPRQIDQSHLDAVAMALAKAGVPSRFASARFDSFQPSAGTKDALSAAKDAAANRSGLVLYGPPGTGKTHLGVAIAAEVYSCWLEANPEVVSYVRDADGYERAHRRRDLIVRFVVVPKLLADLRASFRFRDRVDPLADLYRADLLILDDLGRERTTDWAGESLYDLINERYNDRLPSIVTSNFSLQELADRGYEPQISRLVQDVRVVRLVAPDYRRGGR